jgi:CUB domain
MMKTFLLLLLAAFANAWYESCSNEYTIPTTSTSYFVSDNYPSRYQPGSSCKWYLTAPAGYTIDLKCTFNLDGPLSDCQSQKVFVSREGDKDLNYAERFCGYSELTRRSVGNEISFGYTSNADGSGWLYCEVKAVLTTQENCQCGLSKTVSIMRVFV